MTEKELSGATAGAPSPVGKVVKTSAEGMPIRDIARRSDDPRASFPAQRRTAPAKEARMSPERERLEETKADIRDHRDSAPALYSIALSLLGELRDARKAAEALNADVSQLGRDLLAAREALAAQSEGSEDSRA